ncbi:hypothetical protein M501DRAFT_994334 [Patellaria atrata CBS 101060]|uniref:Zinc finger Mcm10/DnaG-type domain-containing protein n=1 Tax=Patellaria atrata CBS 101060 TaxID=1346257 RepID=A0A9P4SIZ5_9PEZI|nr:hypothetical protein M501DRAFT_994334 [Patellaria atrata CBS 101060]
MSRVPTSEPQWPPKSPHQALLSSPSGRRKYESRRQRDSTSPSPLKRTASTSNFKGRALHLPSDGEEEEDDDDEETLQLQLQAIEAKLKLKRLQHAKAKQGASSDGDNDSIRAHSRASTATSNREARPGASISNSRSSSSVQVPLSPARNQRPQPDPPSPARVLLGIDKGLRAQDVSLKRASSFRSQRTSASVAGSGLSRSKSVLRAGGSANTGTLRSEAPRGKSFSERIAESRLNERERMEKEKRISKARSRSFRLQTNDSSDQHNGFQDVSKIRQGGTQSASGSGESPFSSRPSGRHTMQQKSIPTLGIDSLSSSMITSSSNHTTTSITHSQRSASSHSTISKPKARKLATPSTDFEDDPFLNLDENKAGKTSEMDSFSGLHLSKRHIPHLTLTRTLEGKELYPIPRLLATVKKPDYDAPDVESDYVVFGVIASKSDPRECKGGPKVVMTGDAEEADARPKFMVMRLTDFKWELDLFLFDTGFERFWKLAVGTVVAILNPDILPPRNRDTGAFSLKIGSSDDTVLEIGMSRDLGFCKSIKKDGHQCKAWIDKRKTEFCEFHINLQIEKTKSGRMEVNSMTGFGRGREGGGSMFARSGARGTGALGRGGKRASPPRTGQYHDKFLHETVYIAPSAYRNAFNLIDEDEADSGAFERGYSREELHRKRLAEREKEKDLAKKLGAIGSKMGAEYMRTRTEESSKIAAVGAAQVETLFAPTEPLDAAALGLLDKKASDVKLGAVKRKCSQANINHQPVGWSGAFKRDLLSPSKKFIPSQDAGSEEAAREPSPKKRARFMLADKGIRKPGRESLGVSGVVMDDDDDDLDIV